MSGLKPRPISEAEALVVLSEAQALAGEEALA
jgi:hypothetical protein